MSGKALFAGGSLRNWVLAGTACVVLTSVALLLLGLSHHTPISRPGQDREQLEARRREHFLGEDGLVRDLVYVSDRAAMERLACPQDHTLTCFYRFTMLGDDIKQPTEGLVTEDDCDAVFRALVADHADKPWCIRQVRSCAAHSQNIHRTQASQEAAGEAGDSIPKGQGHGALMSLLKQGSQISAVAGQGACMASRKHTREPVAA